VLCSSSPVVELPATWRESARDLFNSMAWAGLLPAGGRLGCDPTCFRGSGRSLAQGPLFSWRRLCWAAFVRAMLDLTCCLVGDLLFFVVSKLNVGPAPFISRCYRNKIHVIKKINNAYSNLFFKKNHRPGRTSIYARFRCSSLSTRDTHLQTPFRAEVSACKNLSRGYVYVCRSWQSCIRSEVDEHTTHRHPWASHLSVSVTK